MSEEFAKLYYNFLSYRLILQATVCIITLTLSIVFVNGFPLYSLMMACVIVKLLQCQ